MTTDPLDALREPLRPVRPDPAFAASLRTRLERLLLDPTLPLEEDDMTTSTAVALRPGDLSYAALWTPDVDVADRFYRAVLGWETTGGHGGFGRRVTGTRFEMALYPEASSTLFFAAVVDDADAAAERARAAGGTVGERHEMPYGVLVDCHDDQGLQFALHEPPTGGSTVDAGPPRPGELAYVAVQVPDAGRARAFYGSVLGWGFRAGSRPGNWHVEVDGSDTRPTLVGVGEQAGGPHVAPMFAVDDVAAACAAVRAAGGTAEEPRGEAYGTTAECRDDQGGRFWVARF